MPKFGFKVQSNFIEITFCHGCCPVNLLQFLRTSFPKKTSEGLLLEFINELLCGFHKALSIQHTPFRLSQSCS